MNCQLALGVYLRDLDARVYLPVCLDVFAVEGEKISRVIAFPAHEAFSRVGLPEKLPV